MVNALVVKPWVARTLAALGVLAFVGVQTAEFFGIVSYAPDAPEWVQLARPGLPGVIAASVLVAILLGVSTFVVSRLMSALRAHEQELMKLNAQLEALSQRDPLTQLFNRRYLLDRIDLELARVRRGHGAALLMIDLDGFKRINDRHGHLRGDDLLKRIADAIGGSVRATDVAGRYGGDEFAVLLSDTESEQARVAAERLVNAIRECSERETDDRVTASVGIAIALGDDDSRSLLRRADEYAYRAKQHGGDRVAA
jgi:diguanylate cyclase